MNEDIKSDLEHQFKTYGADHQAGRYAEAEKGYQTILDQRPNWGEVLCALGNLYLDQNLPDKAKPLFEKASRLNPPDLSACYNLGRLNQLDNNHSGAVPLYKTILAYQPYSGLVWNNLGVAYRETGKSDNALSSFKKAVKFAPHMAHPVPPPGCSRLEP